MRVSEDSGGVEHVSSANQLTFQSEVRYRQPDCQRPASQCNQCEMLHPQPPIWSAVVSSVVVGFVSSRFATMMSHKTTTAAADASHSGQIGPKKRIDALPSH